MKLDRLEIHRLRGIRRETFEGLRAVNVLRGRAGIGKTTVLEALAILASGGNPETAFADRRLNRRIVEKRPDAEELWTPLFHEGAVSHKIRITGVSERWGRSSRRHEAAIDLRPAANAATGAARREAGGIGEWRLRLRYRCGESPSARDDTGWDKEGTLVCTRNHVGAWGNDIPIAAAVTRLLPSPGEETPADVARFARLVRTGRGDAVVTEALREVRGDVTEMAALAREGRPRLYVRTAHAGRHAGTNEAAMLPLASLGNEAVQVTRAAIAGAAHESGLLLADEPASGRSREAARAIGKSLARAAAAGQVFVTAAPEDADELAETARKEGVETCVVELG